MNAGRSIIGGFAGAIVLTAFHQFLKNKVEDAPRMDELGVEALRRIFGDKVPQKENQLYKMSLFSDLIYNGLTFSLAALSKKKLVLVGSLLGIGMGIGATTLPEKLGFSKEFSAANLKTSMLSVIYYLSGGMASGALIKSFR